VLALPEQATQQIKRINEGGLMANPQTENGYTAIANEILDAIAKITLSPTGYKILFVVWRQTYGFKRCQYGLSDTFLAKATGAHPKLINREINRLINRNILTLYKQGTYTEPRQLGFNKNYDTWLPDYQLNKGYQLNSRYLSNEGRGTNQTVDEVPTKQLPKEINLNKPKKNIYTHESQECILAKYLLKMIRENIPSLKEPDIQKWSSDIDKLLRVDKRQPGEVKAIIEFSQKDDFWKTNILSPAKLRKQYDQLTIQRKQLLTKTKKAENKSRSAVPLGGEVEEWN
jgi:phage replication O-like protein O